jgi:hypothetical protein
MDTISVFLGLLFTLLVLLTYVASKNSGKNEVDGINHPISETPIDSDIELDLEDYPYYLTLQLSNSKNLTMYMKQLPSQMDLDGYYAYLEEEAIRDGQYWFVDLLKQLKKTKNRPNSNHLN